MSKKEEYVARLRELNGLKNVILYGITVTQKDKVAEFSLVTDKTYSAMETATAQEITQEYLPAGFSAKVKIIKRVPDAETIKKKIYDYMQAQRTLVLSADHTMVYNPSAMEVWFSCDGEICSVKPGELWKK